jgi:hypothetical protein
MILGGGVRGNLIEIEPHDVARRLLRTAGQGKRDEGHKPDHRTGFRTRA